jgi:hypothetical protein
MTKRCRPHRRKPGPNIVAAVVIIAIKGVNFMCCPATTRPPLAEIATRFPPKGT